VLTLILLVCSIAASPSVLQALSSGAVAGLGTSRRRGLRAAVYGIVIVRWPRDLLLGRTTLKTKLGYDDALDGVFSACTSSAVRPALSSAGLLGCLPRWGYARALIEGHRNSC